MEGISNPSPSVIEIKQDIHVIRQEINAVRSEAHMLLGHTIDNLKQRLDAEAPTGNFAAASTKFRATAKKQIRSLEKLQEQVVRAKIKDAKQAEKLVGKVTDQLEKIQRSSAIFDKPDILPIKNSLKRLTTHLTKTSNKIDKLAQREMTISLPLDKRIKAVLSKIAHIKGANSLPKLEKQATELEKLIAKKEAWIAPRESSNQHKIEIAKKQIENLRSHLARDFIAEEIAKQLADVTLKVKEHEYSVEYTSSNVDIMQSDIAELANISTTLRSGKAKDSELALKERLKGIDKRHIEAEEELRETKAAIEQLKAEMPGLEGNDIALLRAEFGVEVFLRDKGKNDPYWASKPTRISEAQSKADEIQAQIKATMPREAVEAATQLKDLAKHKETLEGKIESLKSSEASLEKMIADVRQGRLRQVRKLIEAQKAKTEPLLREFKALAEVATGPEREQQRLVNLQRLLADWTSDESKLLEPPDPSIRNQETINSWLKHVNTKVNEAKEAFKEIIDLKAPSAASKEAERVDKENLNDSEEFTDIPLD